MKLISFSDSCSHPAGGALDATASVFRRLITNAILTATLIFTGCGRAPEIYYPATGTEHIVNGEAIGSKAPSNKRKARAKRRGATRHKRRAANTLQGLDRQRRNNSRRRSSRGKSSRTDERGLRPEVKKPQSYDWSES